MSIAPISKYSYRCTDHISHVLEFYSIYVGYLLNGFIIHQIKMIMFNFILFILSVLNNLIKGELTVDWLIMVLQELSILYILCCKSYLHI